MMAQHTWIALCREAIAHNVRLFRQHVGPDVRLLVPVKANAYGHSIREMAPALVEAGVDWLGVHSLPEAIEVQDTGIQAPVLIVGYVPFAGLKEVVTRGFHLTVSTWETAEAMARAAAELGMIGRVHIKIETGTNRQGVRQRELQILARFVVDSPHLSLEGCSTHFANIEDTTDHTYALGQLANFQTEIDALAAHDIAPKLCHTACSAAAMLFKETHFDMVRTGIAMYGLWPSRETFVSLHQDNRDAFPLRPILSWKTMIAQIKDVPAGEYVGYGCSFRTTRDIRLAILPIGYYDGYDRGLSNIGYVLVHGKRAPIRGRICMNLTMVDVTDIPGVQQQDEVVLIGEQGDETISVDLLASLIGTINYEVVARLPHHIPRTLVP